MIPLAEKIVDQFGWDTSQTTQYQFNKLGFRSPEIIAQDSLFVIGNTLSFGLGINESDTYACLLSQYIKRSYANLSFACYLHENHDYLINIKNLARRPYNDIFVIQINNLDRRRDQDQIFVNNDSKFCIDYLIDYFEQLQTVLKNKKVIYLYWDDKQHEIPNHIKNQLLIHNKFHLDCSLSNGNNFGVKTHLAIAKIISSKIAKFA